MSVAFHRWVLLGSSFVVLGAAAATRIWWGFPVGVCGVAIALRGDRGD